MHGGPWRAGAACRPSLIPAASILAHCRIAIWLWRKQTWKDIRGAKVPGSESSMSLLLRGTKVPRNESSRERKCQGAKVPGSESTWERKFLLPVIAMGQHVCQEINENEAWD